MNNSVTIKIPRTKGCNNLVEIDCFDFDGWYNGTDKVYCNEENKCEECKNE